MDEPKPIWANLIRAEREARGWSQEELAERLGVTRQTVGGWESGDQQPTKRDNLRAIASVLNLDLAVLPRVPRPSRRDLERHLGAVEERLGKLERDVSLRGEQISELRDVLSRLSSAA